MKRKISLILALVLICAFCFQTIVSASNISTYNNNTFTTSTIFSLSSVGKAVVYYEYEGYEGITTGATINILIQKRNFLIFWTDVIDETITLTGVGHEDELVYHFTEQGTYKCTVTYRVSGTGGEDDVITYERTESW